MQNRYKPFKELSSRQFSQFDLYANNSFQPKDDQQSFSSFESDHEAATVLKKQKHNKSKDKENYHMIINHHETSKNITKDCYYQKELKYLEQKQYIKFQQQLEQKNAIICEKNRQIRNLLNKYQQLNKVNQSTTFENKQLKEENTRLKQKINSAQFSKSAKKTISLAKQNNCLKMEIEKLKSDQQFNKLNEEVQHKNYLMKQVQNLHEKHKKYQQQLAQQMKRKENQLKLVYQKQINKFNKQNEWMKTFFQVFIDMILKIPIQINENWSLKKKVRIGWKAIKLMIKRSLGLGIQPPQIKADN